MLKADRRSFEPFINSQINTAPYKISPKLKGSQPSKVRKKEEITG
jgi:hypothetical protein